MSLPRAVGVDEDLGKPGASYKQLRDEWERRRKDAEQAAQLERLARMAAEAAERRTRRHSDDALGFLMAIPNEAAKAALASATEQLGPDADQNEITILAATLADAAPQEPDDLGPAAKQALADQGCPNGCPLGYHEPPCLYADAEDS